MLKNSLRTKMSPESRAWAPQHSVQQAFFSASLVQGQFFPRSAKNLGSQPAEAGAVLAERSAGRVATANGGSGYRESGPGSPLGH